MKAEEEDGWDEGGYMSTDGRFLVFQDRTFRTRQCKAFTQTHARSFECKSQSRDAGQVKVEEEKATRGRERERREG